MVIAHLAFDLGLGHQRGNRVDDDHVNGIGAHQHIGDFQRLFAGIRLGYQQVIDIHTQLGGVFRIERMLGVNEGAGGTLFLRLGDDRQGKCGLA